MSDYMLDEYEEYLEDFRAWGHEYQARALSYAQFERLKLEYEYIDSAEECGRLSKKQRQRRERIEKLLLSHESYYADGPRVTVTIGQEG